MVDRNALDRFQPSVGYQPERERPAISREEIITVIPAAAGYWCVCRGPYGSTGGEKWRREPVPAWGLVRRVGGRTAVVLLIINPDGLELAERKTTTTAEYLHIESDFDDAGVGQTSGLGSSA